MLQGFIYINLDKDMQDPATKEFARARNTNLNEDLGKIEYVFSDKTGTLTSNEMQLREIAIKGVAFGTSEFKCACCLNFFYVPPLFGFEQAQVQPQDGHADEQRGAAARDRHPGRRLWHLRVQVCPLLPAEPLQGL